MIAPHSPFPWVLGPAVLVAAAAVAAVLPAPVAAQASDEEKIAQALGAAPTDVARSATVMDWPASPDADFRVLREGTNDWVCLPDPPGDENVEPMCNDGTWMTWLRSYVSGEVPKVDRLGVSYMLNSRWAISNTDPAAREPTPDNQWLMIPMPEGMGHGGT